MTQRDEAMRAAAESVTIDREPEGEEKAIATAGADAELTRVVEWARNKAQVHHRLAAEAERGDELRTHHLALSSAYREIADALAAHAHWKDEQ